MLTKQDVLTSQEFHYGTCKRIVGPRGGVTIVCERWRANGRVKTWKSRPDDYSLPVKHGMRTYGTITPRNASSMHAAKDCPLNAPCTWLGSTTFELPAHTCSYETCMRD